MLILGIETSCDETAVSVLELSDGHAVRIIFEEISSQSDIHKEYGGVVPELASREHLRNLPLLLEQARKQTGIDFADLDLIGVTRGPGLKGCLLIGICTAQAISDACSLPCLGINHIEGHILSAKLDNPSLEFPYLCMVVSGGHTEIHVVRDVGNYQLIARTIDDAAGEAFDKSANLLNLEYPGGPKLAALADSVQKSRYKLPRVMRDAGAFSFSGLKTAVSLLVKSESENLSQPECRAELAYAVQDAIVRELVEKIQQAMKSTRLQKIAIAGGVSANRCLRQRTSEISGAETYFAKPVHCVDNAAMVAYAAALRSKFGTEVPPSQILSPLSRWPVEEI